MDTSSQNIFLDQPEFIATDPRTQRPEWLAYKVDAEFMYHRHNIFLPKSFVEGKSILDLGSCNAASGAWCLSNGAKLYSGVEFQNEYVVQSHKNLSKYYSNDRWNLFEMSIEDFILNSKNRYDIVIALGVVHAFSDIVSFLHKITSLTNCLVIDGTHPYTVNRSEFLGEDFKKQFLSSDDYIRFIENEPFIGMHRTGMSLHSKKTVLYNGFVPSMGAVKQILNLAGFMPVWNVNQQLKEKLPHVYSPHQKFGLTFLRKANTESLTDAQLALGLVESFKSLGKLPAVDWGK
jgi:hypothetical protein